MLKKILNLNGVQPLSKDEQSEFFGGGRGGSGSGCCDPSVSCCVPQPLPHVCDVAECAIEDPGCPYAYGIPTCPDPNFSSCCI